MNSPLRAAREKGNNFGVHAMDNYLCNIEAEQSVLGSVLLVPEVLDQVAGITTPGEFYREAHGKIFQAMLDLQSRGEPVDTVTVNNLLKERGQLEGVGGPLFLAELSEHVGIAANAAYYAKLVHEKALLRRYEAFGHELVKAAGQAGVSSKDLRLFVESISHDLSSRNSDGSSFPPLERVKPISEAIKNPPPERAYLFKNVLPARIVAGIVAQGGTGKGHVINNFGLSLATCQRSGSLEPARSFRTLCLAGEDGQEELFRRAHAPCGALLPDSSPPAEIDNFMVVSILGQVGPLMMVDGAGNPVNAPGYDWALQDPGKPPS